MSRHRHQFAALIAVWILSSGCTPAGQEHAPTSRRSGNGQAAAPRDTQVPGPSSTAPLPGEPVDLGLHIVKPAEQVALLTAGRAEPQAPGMPPEEATARLGDLSDAFREIARQVRPSVVQVSAEVRPAALQRRLRSQLSEEQLEEFRRRFGSDLESEPELRQFFRGPRAEQDQPDFGQYDAPLPVGNGSGWIYDDQGHIITNHHVVSQADQITLTFYDETEAEAVLVGSDPQTDMAVLKTSKQDLVPARLAREPVAQGDIVLAMGSPFRLVFSVSQGIVSATERHVGILGPQGYENFIQTDAAINPGNSGGPLINTRGDVVGMNTAIASRSGGFAGIGFAIPAEMIDEVVEQLIQRGRIERGYLGLMINDDRRLLASFGAERGVLIEDLVEGGPAEQAGLQPGDVILAINGQVVDSSAALRERVARARPGSTIELIMFRNGQERRLEVTIHEQPRDEDEPERRRPERRQPEDAPEVEALAKLGFERLQVVTPEISRQYGLDISAGIAVIDVRQFSAAAIAGIRRGHIITHVQGQQVADIDVLREAVQSVDLTQGVRMRVRSPGGPGRFVLLSLAD